MSFGPLPATWKPAADLEFRGAPLRNRTVDLLLTMHNSLGSPPGKRPFPGSGGLYIAVTVIAQDFGRIAEKQALWVRAPASGSAPGGLSPAFRIRVLVVCAACRSKAGVAGLGSVPGCRFSRRPQPVARRRSETLHGELLQHLSQVRCMLSSLLIALTATDLQHLQHPQRSSAMILPRSYLHVPQGRALCPFCTHREVRVTVRSGWSTGCRRGRCGMRCSIPSTRW